MNVLQDALIIKRLCKTRLRAKLFVVSVPGAPYTAETTMKSGIIKAADPAAMVEEMISALRRAWDELHG